MRNGDSRPGQVYRAVTRRHARSFYFASHVLPPEKRSDAYTIYAFCRLVDNIVDEEMGTKDSVQSRLDELRRSVSAIYDGVTPDDELLRALGRTIETRRVPRGYFLELLNGVGMDLEKRTYETFDELSVYCYRVASVVGQMLAYVFGATTDEALARAADLGTAMQLTNILRDIGEDLKRGRVYVPQEDLDAFGVRREDFERGIVSTGVRSLLDFEIRRARSFYRRADEGFPHIPDDGSRFCARLMSRMYEGILDAIERNGYDVFTRRTYVPWYRKTAVFLRVFFGTTDSIHGRDIRDARSAQALYRVTESMRTPDR
ncbi:MAG: phytoene/squalene synthase family protein [Bacteroidota bacterium]|nr:phytoene/squalene synthase family protein [Bacteroidota bacterium]